MESERERERESERGSRILWFTPVVIILCLRIYPALDLQGKQWK
jgi:hypothetical protein